MLVARLTVECHKFLNRLFLQTYYQWAFAYYSPTQFSVPCRQNINLCQYRLSQITLLVIDGYTCGLLRTLWVVTRSTGEWYGCSEPSALFIRHKYWELIQGFKVYQWNACQDLKLLGKTFALEYPYVSPTDDEIRSTVPEGVCLAIGDPVSPR